ncbi:MAG: glucosyltransferase domain-containing protein [Albidovulum sp.]
MLTDRTALAWLTPARALWVAAALYALITGYGVLNDGYHSDDWRHLGGVSPLWTAVEGRWLLEVIYRDLLGERFLLPIQLLLAFPCLYWVAHVVAGHAAEADARPAATLSIFVIGTHHVFMTDVLSFGSNVFAYPLALALTTLGFEIIWRTFDQTRARQIGAVLIGAQALAFSIAIYQTFAVAGLIVPLLVLLRADKHSFGAALRLALVGALASVLAIALYLVEWRIYAGVIGVEIVSERFQAADAAGFGAKLRELPVLLRGIHTGSVMKLPFGLRALMGLFSLAALGFFVLAAVAGFGGRHAKAKALLDATRFGIGSFLAFFVFPILFWLAYQGDNPPPRAFGFLGFWTAAVFLAGLTVARATLPPRLRLLITTPACAMLVLVGLVLSLTSSAIWSDSARAGARDLELARAITARLSALPGYTGPPFRIVGSADNSDLSWGTLAGWSTFHGGNPNMGIFRQTYGLDTSIIDLPVSPRHCGAFPAADAAFIHEGMAYLCLNDFEPYTADLACAPLAAEGAGHICLGATAFVHIGPTCLGTGKDDPELRVAFRRSDRPVAVDRSFSVASFPIPMDGTCHTVALAPGQTGLDALDLRMRAPDGTQLWAETINLTALRPYAP